MRIRAFLFASFLLVLLCTTRAIADPAVIRPFDAGSYAKILSANQGRPLLLVFWSVDCPPCHKELAILGELRRNGAVMNLVLVSTDDIATADSIREILRQRGLSDVEAWAFADPVAAKARYSVDPKWYGELPRSYFFAPTHVRTAHSGALTEEAIRQWLERLKTSR